MKIYFIYENEIVEWVANVASKSYEDICGR